MCIRDRTIEEGRGSPEDLVNYVELSAGYYVDQLKDPVKAADPVFQEAALHHQIAKTQGGAGLVGFCVAQMQEAVMQGVRMREIRATKTSDRYLTKAQHWARLMGQINLRNIPKPTV